MGQTYALMTFGSQGDTRPVVALGQGLRERGHTVRILASKRFADTIAAAGLEHHPMDVDPLEVLATDEGQEALASRDPFTLMRNFRRVVGPYAERAMDQGLEMSRGADAILAPAIGFVGYNIAQHLRIPTALLHLQPGEPTRTAANPLVLAGRSLGRPLNRLSYALVEKSTWTAIRPIVDDWRQSRLGMPKVPRGGPFRAARGDDVPVLCGWSPAVAPPPADWAPNVHVTGYWFLGEEEAPSADVAAFLEAGPAPVYVGFGSMVPKDPEELARTVRRALADAGARGLVVGELPELQEALAGAVAGPGRVAVAPRGDVATAAAVPHTAVFPRSAAVVHHGGAGTTAAGLRAGAPTITCTFFSDQPYWGHRVAALGAGPTPLPIGKVTPEALAERIRRAVTDPAMRARAAAVGRQVSGEDGVGRACDVLESWLPGARPPRLP